MYNVFISHSWKHNNEYDRLVTLLKEYPYFNFKNYSVPATDPLDISGVNYKKNLRSAIENQMRSASCVLVVAGLYISYSDSIQMEIDIAKELHKPIIAVEPYGSLSSSRIVKDSADAVVGWRASSIVQAIRMHSL